ncbi:MAG: hypothetical protein RBR69_02100 [Candidatus Cloacimonadaceae bacterium]|nr:hypothetical protein [Candidatus Cloacimonadota bacterium]MDY0126917.1 hypothetical protein [Candidatus Cloacimonadaceae bacterium]
MVFCYLKCRPYRTLAFVRLSVCYLKCRPYRTLAFVQRRFAI